MSYYEDRNLLGKYPQDTYTFMLQNRSGVLVTGDGNSVDLVYVTASNAISASYILSSSYALSSSWAPSIPSTTISASWASQSLSASYAPFNQIEQISCSWSSQSLSASYAPFNQIEQISCSWASQSLSSSFLIYSNNNGTASFAISASKAFSSSYAISASWAPPTTQISCSWASQSLSASYSLSGSYALTASYALNGGGGSTPIITSISNSFYELQIQSAKFSSSLNNARINGGNFVWELLFAKGEASIWQFQLPSSYHSSMSCNIQYYPSSTQTGITIAAWEVDIYNLSAGGNALGPVPTLISSITNSLSNNQPSGAITLGMTWLTGSTFNTNDLMICKLKRTGDALDTVSGDIAVISNLLEWK